MTVSESLQKRAGVIKGTLTEVIRDHSVLYLANPSGSGFFNTSGNYGWRNLGPEGKRLQSKLLSDYRHLYALLGTLLKGQSEDDLKTLEECNELVERIVEQNECTWSKTKEEELERALNAIDKLVQLVDHLFGSTESPVILVPDTNALLYNPSLDAWGFMEFQSFSMILTPAVLSELDQLKVSHRNEEVRAKAERLIRQLKEYRRRGSLLDGVVLRKNVSTIKSIATEPKVSESLPWLQEENSDDRLLASVVEIMRVCPRSAVYLVSRDINIQNKAEFAGIPFLEPPEPPQVQVK